MVNFSCALGQIMTRYDFLWARRIILSYVRISSNLTKFHFSLTRHVQGFSFEIKSWIFFGGTKCARYTVKGGGVGLGGLPLKICVYFKCSRSKTTALFTILWQFLNIISGHFFTEHFVCGHFRYRLPILPDESALIMQVVLKIGLLQWQIVLGDILKWF